MSDEDRKQDIRQWVKGLSPEELQELLAGILGGGLADLAAEPEPPSPPLPQVPDPPTEQLALTVRVDVDGTRPPVWRRLVLHGDLTLDEVHVILQAAFGWLDTHLHRFWPGPRKELWTGPHFLTEGDVEEGEEGILESEVRLDQVLRAPGDRLFYTYDFGDAWHHTIKLESVSPLDEGSPPAVCTAGRMAGPLEDCGGPYGHNELVAAYRADPSLADLDEEQRDWLPPGWDPTEFAVEEVAERLSYIGLSTDELLDLLSGTQPSGADWPEAVEPVLDLAPPAVVAELTELTARARTEHEGELSAEDLAAIARPYRYLVDLAGEDGIPLTGAGWMRPAYVERIYTDLGLDQDWVGKGNREDQTAPVAQLRSTCQDVGLLRKHKGRLLPTRLAQGLGTDEEYVAAVAARLYRDRDTFVSVAKGLFGLLTAATGRPAWEHGEVIARILTACHLRTGPAGVEPQHVVEWVRPVWMALRRASGEKGMGRGSQHDHRAVGLARAALWPEELGRGGAAQP